MQVIPCRAQNDVPARDAANTNVNGGEGTEIALASCCGGSAQEENPMTGKYLIAAALVSVCAVTASAQTTTEYYVVQDSATKKCTIVDKKPTTSTMVQVGPVAFKTRNEAEAGMKTITVCSSN
jgi:hypothetical protein